MSDEPTTARAALVQDGVVTNVVLVALDDSGSTDFAPEGVKVVVLPDNSSVGADWTYANGKFTSPEE